ncbi:MAG: hypothetical protein JWR15_2589 [Prosthecobacter sp.]|nr:hypothetical protein [Prosthecobacter sp.]
MTRTQIQFPDPLYQRLKEIAERQDWSLSEVMRKAAEHFITRFPEDPKPRAVWRFPTLDCGGDFVTDPAKLHAEADAILARNAA